MCPAYETRSPVHMTNKILSCMRAPSAFHATALYSTIFAAWHCSMNSAALLLNQRNCSDCTDQNQILGCQVSYILRQFYGS